MTDAGGDLDAYIRAEVARAPRLTDPAVRDRLAALLRPAAHPQQGGNPKRPGLTHVHTRRWAPDHASDAHDGPASLPAS